MSHEKSHVEGSVSPESATGFLAIPDDILVEILLFLPFHAAKSVALSCKSMFNLTMHPDRAFLQAHFRKCLFEKEVLGLYQLRHTLETSAHTAKSSDVVLKREVSMKPQGEEKRMKKFTFDDTTEESDEDEENGAAPAWDGVTVDVKFLYEETGITTFYGGRDHYWDSLVGEGSISTEELREYFFQMRSKVTPAPRPIQIHCEGEAAQGEEDGSMEEEDMTSVLQIQLVVKADDVVFLKMLVNPETGRPCVEDDLLSKAPENAVMSVAQEW